MFGMFGKMSLTESAANGEQAPINYISSPGFIVEFSMKEEFYDRLNLKKSAENARDKLKAETGYEFKNLQILARALLHKSYMQKKRETQEERDMSYQSFVSLGDQIIKLLILSEIISKSTWTSRIEQRINLSLEALIKAQAVTMIAFHFPARLDQLVLVDVPEIKESITEARDLHYMQQDILRPNSRKHFMATVLKALFGAAYLDSGMDFSSTKLIFEKTFGPHIETVMKHHTDIL